jgi:hypothetical protein
LKVEFYNFFLKYLHYKSRNIDFNRKLDFSQQFREKPEALLEKLLLGLGFHRKRPFHLITLDNHNNMNSDLELYRRKAKTRTFLPSASYKGLNRQPKLLTNEIVEDEDANREKFDKDQQFFDSETGEPLQLTKAKWTPTEGRLSLNANTILNMGTGMLDLKYSSQGNRNSIASSQQNTLATTSTVTNSSMHPIVQRFLKEGPLTPMMHENWNPLTDQVDSLLQSETHSVASSQSSSSTLKKKSLASASLITASDNTMRELIAKYNAEVKSIVPDQLGRIFH